MKRAILLPLLGFIGICQLTGQVFIGPKAGLSLSVHQATGGYGEITDPVLKPGFLVGAVMELPFSSSFSMQIEGYYVQKGSSDKLKSNLPVSGTFKQKCIESTLPYLSVPLFFKYRFQGRPLGGFISAGSELSFGFNGKIKNFSGEESELIVGSDQLDQYKKSDWGLLFGGGLSYEISVGEIVLDARYVMGLTNINGKSQVGILASNNQLIEADTRRNRSLQVSLGIIFPLGG